MVAEADLTAFYRIRDATSEDSARQIVTEYWTTARSDYMEVLVQAPAEVLERF